MAQIKSSPYLSGPYIISKSCHKAYSSVTYMSLRRARHQCLVMAKKLGLIIYNALTNPTDNEMRPSLSPRHPYGPSDTTFSALFSFSLGASSLLLQHSLPAPSLPYFWLKCYFLFAKLLLTLSSCGLNPALH